MVAERSCGNREADSSETADNTHRAFAVGSPAFEKKQDNFVIGNPAFEKKLVVVVDLLNIACPLD